MAKKLPTTIFVAWSGGPPVDEYLNAHTDASAVLEDDGPTIVGTYQLVDTNELHKVVKTTPRRRRTK